MKRPPLKRLILGAAAPALLVLGLIWFLRGGHLLCPTYELTGLYCPGCGSGRAARAMLRGDLRASSSRRRSLSYSTPSITAA